MEDKLSDRYRNISGTILVINDLNYLEIGINEVVNLSLFSEEFLSKSRGLREHIALKNLIPDDSDVQAKQIDENSFKTDQKLLDDNFIKKLASEVSKLLPENKTEATIDLEIIKLIASEIGKEIASNINQSNNYSVQELLQDIEDKNKIVNVNNEYEKNIIDSSIDRMQEALAARYPQIQQKPPTASEENFDGSEDYVSDLKDIINNSGGNKNA